VEDALHATRAAVEEGIVPGGGVAYLRCLDALDKLKFDEEDQQIGAAIVRKALEEPLRQIVANSGLEPSIILDTVKKNKKFSFGFDAAKEEYADLMEAGIIDPTKVARYALQNAASIAGLLLTTEASVVEKPEEKRELGPGGMPPSGVPGMY
jgi:chaperonin GroEL